MDIKATVHDPENGEKVELRYSWSDGYLLVDDHTDTEWNRFHIAFFVESPEGKAGSRSFPAPTNPQGDGAHSLLAIAVCGNKVVSKDRKLVRDVKSEQP
ncbi:MAG: hypothetical protein KF797_08960 [Flavobacteriales bacterium]|nr:hypothetical protein [Flavobacteriales bacterium]